MSDGDTLQVQDALGTKVKVRLYGIDAPETEKKNRKTGRVSKPGQPYGEEAFRALKGKVGGQFVKVEVADIDRYKRAVSVVRYGNRDINQEMVREGFGGRGIRSRLGSLGGDAMVIFKLNDTN